MERIQMGEAARLRQAFECARRDTAFTWHYDNQCHRLRNERVDLAAQALWTYHRSIALIILSSPRISRDIRVLLARIIMTDARVWRPPTPQLDLASRRSGQTTRLVQGGIHFATVHPTARVVIICTSMRQLFALEPIIPDALKKRVSVTIVAGIVSVVFAIGHSPLMVIVDDATHMPADVCIMPLIRLLDPRTDQLIIGVNELCTLIRFH